MGVLETCNGNTPSHVSAFGNIYVSEKEFALLQLDENVLRMPGCVKSCTTMNNLRTGKLALSHAFGNYISVRIMTL